MLHTQEPRGVHTAPPLGSTRATNAQLAKELLGMQRTKLLNMLCGMEMQWLKKEQSFKNLLLIFVLTIYLGKEALCRRV